MNTNYITNLYNNDLEFFYAFRAAKRGTTRSFLYGMKTYNIELVQTITDNQNRR